MLQKKLGGQTYQLNDTGQLVPTDIWTVDYDEADMLVGAIQGFRSVAPEVPSKWMLPLSAAWLGGIVLFTFGTRLSTWKGWKQAMSAQMEQANRQQTAQTAYTPPVNSQNGQHVQPEAMAVASVMGVSPDEWGPPINDPGY